MNYRKNQMYFKNPNWAVPILLLIIGGICIIEVSIIWGVVIFAVGTGLIYENMSLPTDKQYDKEVVKKLEGFNERALNKLGIDEDEVNEIEPIIIGGFNYKDFDKYKTGKDNRLRTNVYKQIIFFFSQEEVHCYLNEFNTTVDKQVEKTNVYFYKDIVSVATTSTNATLNGNRNYQYDTFELTTTGGSVLTVSIDNPEEMQRSINGMRQLIREKKRQN